MDAQYVVSWVNIRILVINDKFIKSIWQKLYDNATN